MTSYPLEDERGRPVETLLDPRKPHFLTIIGAKGTGKSVLGTHIFDTYPGDRLAIDPTHDLRVANVTETINATRGDELPSRFPERDDPDDPRPVVIRYIPDFGAPTYRDELDAAVGLAMTHRNTCCLIDEIGELTSANFTPPNMRRALQQGRHYGLTLIMCGPRAIDINPLVLHQADYVYVFRLPHPRDRERVAANCFVDQTVLDDALAQLPQHAYLRIEPGAQDDEDRIIEFPPLPVRRRAKHPPEDA